MITLKELSFLKENSLSLDEFRLKLEVLDVATEEVIVAGVMTGVVIRDVNTTEDGEAATDQHISPAQSFCFTPDDFILP